MPAEKSATGETRQRNLNRHAEGLIAGVNRRMSCRSIFSQYKILTLPSLYILVSLCFIKKLNDNLKC
jgi:hypothetical protein